MSDAPQNFKNHVRYHPPFHFVLMPLVLLNLLWCFYALYRHPGFIESQMLLVGLILAVVGLIARTSALKAQDRVIRLEEKLRYHAVLSPELAQRAEALSTAQVIALRFASNAELPKLIEQVLAGNLKTNKEIKMAVQDWRGDYLRV